MVELCKRLYILVRVHLLVCHVISNSPPNRLVEPLSLPAHLRKVDCGEVVSGTEYLAYGVKEFGEKLFSVVIPDVLGGAVRVNPVLPGSQLQFRRYSIPKRDMPCQFDEPVSYA